jgi:hypothetical protein
MAFEELPNTLLSKAFLEGFRQMGIYQQERCIALLARGCEESPGNYQEKGGDIAKKTEASRVGDL